MTLLELKTEVKARPGFRLFSDSTQLDDEIERAAQQALADFWESYYRTYSHYEKVTALAGLTVPTGTAQDWGTNGKMYELTPATTGAIPTDLVEIKKLWITNESSVITYSSSSYDEGATEGDGIPDASDDTALSVSNVFHEYSGTGTGRTLQIYIGDTAAGTTPKLHLRYGRTTTALSNDSDEVDIPPIAGARTDYLALLDSYLRKYVGFSE